ncbi:MAG TPA: aspartate aminotransferase family protein [Thermoplasmata archaeon]|nr:aspartate aminotransferase family protein [Thermoplasmata archaeon]
MSEEPAVGHSNLAGWRAQRGWAPIEIERGAGARFWTRDGEELLDFASQLVATNLGWGNSAVATAIARQAASLAYIAPSFSTGVRRRVTQRLGKVLPKGLEHFFFSPSGTEANEAALRMARAATGRSGIIALERSYHGATAGSLSVSGDLRRNVAGSSSEVPGTHFAPNCYCYRCPLGLSYPSCGVACADEVDRLLDRSRGEVAAMIVEPVVGTNGVLVPVPEYLPRLRSITKEHDVLLIADEVMTGWGRTGDWFAVQRFGVEPDILTTAKGITGGYVPLGLTATTRAVRDAFEDRMLPVGHTYEAHPVALAAAEAAIGEYESLGLVPRSRREGEHLLERLRAIALRHPSVGEVRGVGLFAAVELVSDRATRIPFNTPADRIAGRPLVVDEVLSAMRLEGVYAIGWVSHIVLAPPLVIERADLDRGLDVLDRALLRSDAHARASRGAASDGTGQI